MKQYFGLGLAMLAGTVIGAAAVSGLHAQAKPPVYLITEIDVTNPEAYAAEFAPKAQATIKAAGGRFVVIGGTAGVGAKPITAMGQVPAKAAYDPSLGQHERNKCLVQRRRLSSGPQNWRKVCDIPQICH